MDPRDKFAHAQRGALLSSQGKLEQAIAAYHEVLRIVPDWAPGYFDLGQTLKRQGELEKAIAAFRRATELEPRNGASSRELAILLYNHAASLGHRGKTADAMTTYEEAIALFPELAEAHHNLGNLYGQLGNTGEALLYIRRAHELGTGQGARWNYPSGEWLENAALRRARQLYGRGQTCEADPLFAEIVEAHPEMTRLAEVLERERGRSRSAAELVSDLEKALDEDPHDGYAQNALAWLLVQPDGDASIRDPDRALTLSRGALTATRRLNPDVLGTLAMALFATGEVADAILVQEELLELMDGEDRVDVKLADARAALKRYREAWRTE